MKEVLTVFSDYNLGEVLETSTALHSSPSTDTWRMSGTPPTAPPAWIMFTAAQCWHAPSAVARALSSSVAHPDS